MLRTRIEGWTYRQGIGIMHRDQLRKKLFSILAYTAAKVNFIPSMDGNGGPPNVNFVFIE
jgi:hypothetical protein